MNIDVLAIIAAVLAAIVTYLATPLVMRLATHLEIIDGTEDERRVHETPTPRIGGVAVFFGFAFALFTVLGIALTKTHFIPDGSISTHDLIGLLFGSMLILSVGIWDDVMQMRPRNKFIAQAIVASISMLYGFTISGFSNPLAAHGADAWISFPWWVSLPLTIVWYLGMMNAINFIDGLDGLLSGVTAISCVFLFGAAMLHGNTVVALVVLALGGAAIGFLPYNFNPAKIFLGDAGSLFIGYVFATVSIIGSSKTEIAIGLLVPLVVLALPILDTAAVIARRALGGRRITEADRGHFHHQLVFRFGLNQRQAVLFIYATCFVLGAVALWLAGGLHHLTHWIG